MAKQGKNKRSNLILSIPEEVFFHHIFPLVQYNDLLSLRCVCKQFKQFSNDFIRNKNSRSEHEREINETDCTLVNFIQLDFPTSSFYIKNSGADFFTNPSIPKFLQLYAPKVTHLRVKHFNMCISKEEHGFYTSLSNLQHLQIENVEIGKMSFSQSNDPINNIDTKDFLNFPSAFKNLKTLKLNKVHAPETVARYYTGKFYQFCDQLEYFKYPLINANLNNFENEWVDPCSKSDVVSSPFDLVRESLYYESKPTILKYYDIEHLQNEKDFYFSEENFEFNLFDACRARNIKLLNVNVQLFHKLSPFDIIDFRPFADTVISIRNLHYELFHIELPNLEKVFIPSTVECSFCDYGQGKLKWPNLNALDICIDSSEVKECFSTCQSQKPTGQLLQFLFASVEREKLKDLRIQFETIGKSDSGNFPIPHISDIIRTCSNVTKLELINLMGSNNVKMSKLWSGLSQLEEVVIDECGFVGDDAFFGENREHPSFLQLLKLKRLALQKLDRMPNVTDAAFTNVFRHLKLTELHLTSMAPIKSITTVGICSLLTGKFSRSIEKFSFCGWSLENVSQKEFLQLMSKFRSSHVMKM